MNISLVLTGLATCGGLFFAGADLGWGGEDGCQDNERDVGVQVDVGRASPRAPPASGQSPYSHGSQCSGDGP